MLLSMVDNPEDVGKYQVKAIQLGKTSSVLTDPHYDYVIITTSSLSSAFEKFVNWKTRKGLSVLVRNISDILSDYPNGDQISGISDAAGSVRQYLHDLYYSNGLSYALFAGDKNSVPFRYGCGTNNTWDWVHWDGSQWVTSYNLYRIPADLYFCDFNGDWNVDGADGDGITRYGEIDDDDPDYSPEIYVGRILFQSQQEILNWTEKLIEYEQNPFAGSFNSINKILWSKSDEMQNDGEATSVKNSSTTFSNLTHNIIGESPSGSDLTPSSPTGASIISELNNGYHFYNMYNHGEWYDILVRATGTHGGTANDNYHFGIFRYDSDGGYQPETGNGLDNISNSNKSVIAYAISCDLLQLDESGGNRC